MFFLVYVSSATQQFSAEDLRALLGTCRKNNAELGVTGMLLYKDGNFMQVLEGDEEAVQVKEAASAIPPAATRPSAVVTNNKAVRLAARRLLSSISEYLP